MQKEFPLDLLTVKSIEYEFTEEIVGEQDAEFEFILEFEKLQLEDEEVNIRLEFLGFSTPDMKAQIYAEGFRFNEELEPSSVYVESVHNPVDLKFLKIEQLEGVEKYELELFFDFEYEGSSYKNQSLSLTFQQEN